MTKIRATEVIYEALGRQVKTYTELTDPEAIVGILKLIVDTAHLSSVKRVAISGSVYRENNLGHIEAWYRAIKPKIVDDTDHEQ